MSTTKLRKIEDSFSERLKMLRKERGWSQEDLAIKLDVSAGSVGNWEMGPYEPHPKTLNRIGALFDVDVSYLLHGKILEAATAMRERPPEYGTVDMAALLREVEDARDALDRVAQQLRKATGKPGAAAALTERASVSYEQKRGGTGKNQAREISDAQRLAEKAEGK
jgi:transcriptional regulator with XRE-family HTH domain